MIITTKRTCGLPGEWRGMLASLVMLATWHSEANELTFEFKYKVVAASCTLSVDNPTVSLGANGHLDPTSLVGSNWVFLGESNVSVTLSGCAGTPDAGTLPYVDVTPTGATQSLSAPGLYRDTSSVSQGFGVVMGNIANVTSLSQGALVTPAVPRVKLQTSGAATNQSYNLRVGVTCGDTNNCAGANLSPGTLNASFTLDFNYH